MTKEQEEAIEIIERMIKSYIEADECGLSNNDFKHEIKAMQTVLSMLKEKDKEIENKKKSLDNLENELNRLSERNLELFEESFETQKKNEYWESRIKQGRKDVKGLKLYEIGIVCEDLKEEIEKKDKIIDLMLKAMDKIQDPQVCKYCDNKINLNHGYCVDAGKCKEGIKQYFENKVKE